MTFDLHRTIVEPQVIREIPEMNDPVFWLAVFGHQNKFISMAENGEHCGCSWVILRTYEDEKD